MIEISGLTKRYGDFTAVDHVDLDVADGEFAVLLGPSGSGKTTILRMVNRMVEPTSGTVRVGGRDTAELKPEQLRRSMGYVIQNTGLFPNMTIHKNVATVPHLLGWDRKRIDARVDELLDLVGLDPDTYGPKRPSQLSGGEAQRVGVARALAADPSGAADGRAVRGGRPAHARAAAARDEAAAGEGAQDHPVRHPRHR